MFLLLNTWTLFFKKLKSLKTFPELMKFCSNHPLTFFIMRYFIMWIKYANRNSSNERLRWVTGWKFTSGLWLGALGVSVRRTGKWLLAAFPQMGMEIINVNARPHRRRRHLTCALHFFFLTGVCWKNTEGIFVCVDELNKRWGKATREQCCLDSGSLLNLRS